MALAVRPPHEHTHLRPLTYDEVRQFPDDGYRYELVDGELLVTPSPDKAHQRAVTRLTVEVQSPSTRHRDVGLKLRAYEDAGLAWYWVVDPLEPRLTAHRLVEGRFRQQAGVAGTERYVADEPFRVDVTTADLVA